jgi:MFS family permease
MDTAAAPWRELFQGRRGRLTAGLLLLEALVAIQVLVVATIMPDVRRDLGMVQLYGLAFTVSSLATIGAIPIAGRAVDRAGARAVLLPSLAMFAAGLLVSATAPAMPVVLVGQFLQGAGGGGLYALSIGAIAKTYPDRLRPRVMALLASMWILPGLVGPPIGALVATTVGWRWAFVAPIPALLLAWVLITPALDLVPAPGSDDPPAHDVATIGPALRLMLGAGLVFGSLTFVEPWALLGIAGGALIGIPPLLRLVPPGTLRARPGPAASAASAFLLSAGFLAMDAFLTLMLTQVRGLSLGLAGVVITGATLTWAAGSLWQSSRAERWALSRLSLIGVGLTMIGEIAVASTLVASVPAVVAYLGWAVAGSGMGIAFPTVQLSMMRVAAVGEESSLLSSVLLMDMLGVATGAGLGGASIAIAAATDASLRAGLAGAFAIGLFALLVLAGLVKRIPSGPARA